MAERICKENPPSVSLTPILQRKKLEYFGNTDDPHQLGCISRFFWEVESCIIILEEKYLRERNQHVQKLIASQPIVMRTLSKLHSKILRKMHKNPNMCNPWRGEVEMDIPLEVFEVIIDIINKVGYGHFQTETKAVVTVTIYEANKAKYIFNKLNLYGDTIPKDLLLKKFFTVNLKEEDERCDVVIIKEKPMTWRYYKNREVLSINFSYGYWNKENIPQH